MAHHNLIGVLTLASGRNDGRDLDLARIILKSLRACHGLQAFACGVACSHAHECPIRTVAGGTWWGPLAARATEQRTWPPLMHHRKEPWAFVILCD